MAHVFQSLGELGDHLERRAGSAEFRVVDPPMTLTEAVDSHDVWASQPSVRKVTDYIARQMASTPLNHFERVSDTERKRLTDTPVAALLAKPSKEYLKTPYRFWRDVLVDRLVHDKWCALRTTDEGRPWLDRIPARRFEFVYDSLDRITGIKVFYKDGETETLDPELCVFGDGYSPRGGKSVSPMTTLKNILNEASEGVDYRRQIMANGARVPGYIHRPTPWPNPEARTRFESGWRAFAASGGRAGGTPLLEDGMEYRELNSFKPVDLELMQGRQLTDIEVASAYHIAPELVGARQGNFSNIDAFRQMLYGPALGPYIIEWEEIVDAAFAEGNTYIEANIDAKMRGSFEEQAKATSTAVGGPWMTRDEARARRNLPPVEGGGELITPLNVILGGQASPQDGQTAGGGGPVVLTGDDLKKRVDAAAALIRSGFDPAGALTAVGLDPIAHLGLLPVTLQKPTDPDDVDEELADELTGD